MGAANVEFVEGEAERLPFPDESFDVVISNGVIDLIPDKDAVFAELFRVRGVRRWNDGLDPLVQFEEHGSRRCRHVARAS